MNSLQNLNSSLSIDIFEEIVFRCDSSCDTKALACLSTFFNSAMQELLNRRCNTKRLNLEPFCPGFTIIDTAEALMKGLPKDPVYVNKLEIFRNFKDLASKVSNCAGLTLVILRKNTDTACLFEFAKKEGKEVKINVNLEYPSIEKTSCFLITNDVFTGSESQNSNGHVTLVENYKCDFLGYLESLFLCSKSKNEKPGISGRLSSFVAKILIFGPVMGHGKVFALFGINSDEKTITITGIANNYPTYGVGGKRKCRVFKKD